MLFYALGIPLLSVTVGDYERIEELFKIMKPPFNKTKASKWSDLLLQISTNEVDEYPEILDVYEKYNLEFPYFLNTLRSISEEIKKDDNPVQ
jgi:hypothetical protein